MPVATLAFLCLLQPQLSTGEAALRSMLKHYGALRNVQISVSKSARDRKGDPLVPGLSGLIAYATPTRFRYEHSEYWGGGTVYVSDGNTLKIMSVDGGPTRLRKSGATLMKSHPSLGPGAGSFAMVLLLMEGPSVYDRLVVANTPVTLQGRRIEFKSKDFGMVTIFVDNGLASEIQFDNKPNRMATYRLTPMFGDPPEDPLEFEALSYSFDQRFPNRTFDTSVKKGEDVIDERKPA